MSILHDDLLVAQNKIFMMLPGDEQLVPYGEDTSIDMSFSLPPSMQSPKVLTAIELIQRPVPGAHTGKGLSVRLWHRATR